MQTKQTLTRHQDIQNWVASKSGLPAIKRIADQSGTIHPRLTLNFARRRGMPTSTPTQDDGMSPVSWTAWLAELDRQRLALRVSQGEEFELIERKDLN